MEWIFRLAGALLVLLEICGIVPLANQFLPLGGSHIAQIAVVLGFAFVINEIASILYGR